FHHGRKPVPAAAGKMLVKSDPLEQAGKIHVLDLARGLAGTKRDDDRDQPLHDQGVAVARELDDRPVRPGLELACEPDLAHAALDLVLAGLELIGHGGQALAQADDVVVALIAVEEFEGFDDVFRLRHGHRPSYVSFRTADSIASARISASARLLYSPKLALDVAGTSRRVISCWAQWWPARIATPARSTRVAR